MNNQYEYLDDVFSEIESQEKMWGDRPILEMVPRWDMGITIDDTNYFFGVQFSVTFTKDEAQEITDQWILNKIKGTGAIDPNTDLEVKIVSELKKGKTHTESIFTGKETVFETLTGYFEARLARKDITTIDNKYIMCVVVSDDPEVDLASKIGLFKSPKAQKLFESFYTTEKEKEEEATV